MPARAGLGPDPCADPRRPSIRNSSEPRNDRRRLFCKFAMSIAARKRARTAPNLNNNSGLLGDGGWRHGGRGCRRQVGYRSCCACSGQSVWSGARGAGRSLSAQQEPILEPGLSRLYCSLRVRCGDPAHRVGRGPCDVFEKFLNLLRTSPNLCSVYNDLNKVWNGHPMDAYGELAAACIASALKQDATPRDLFQARADVPLRRHHLAGMTQCSWFMRTTEKILRKSNNRIGIGILLCVQCR
jgi:hypothetical protein